MHIITISTVDYQINGTYHFALKSDSLVLEKPSPLNIYQHFKKTY